MSFELLFGFVVVLLFCLLFYIKKVDADLTIYFKDYSRHTPGLLRDKVIWITGASSGIGEQLAYELARHRTKLILSGTNEERLIAVKNKCLGIGLGDEDVFVLPFNITDFDQHQDCVNKVLQKFRTLDVLVNNGGRSQLACFADVDIEVDKELFHVNVFGTVNLTRKVLPHFLENKRGHLVVTSSCAGRIGGVLCSSYTASKHALQGYFESIRRETIGKNIDITILYPGPVSTNVLKNAYSDTLGKEVHKSSACNDGRMRTSRCARLMAVAIAHKLDEAWISIQPCLFFCYLEHYCPSLFKKLVRTFYTAKRAEDIRRGRW